MRRSDGIALGLLLLVLAALFHSVLFGGRILYQRDIGAYFYPFAEVFTRILREGSWPLWNPYVAFGQPLLANPQFEVFYPPTWTMPLLSPWTYYTAFVVLHCLIGAVGTYVLCRMLSRSAAASFVAAAVWLTCGPWLSLANLWHHMAGAAWMPCHLAAAEWCLRAPSRTRTLVWGVLAGVQLLAGSADMALLSAALVGGRLVAHVAAERHRWRSRLGASVLACVVAVGLSAAQWLPSGELAARSSRRTLGASDSTEWSVHPLFLLQAVVPVPFKDLRLGRFPSELVFESREPLLFSLYLGFPAAAMVVAAMVGRETPWRRYLVAALVIATAIALGRYTPVYETLLALFPALGMLRYPMKAMVAAALPWSLLAGLGFDQVGRGLGGGTRSALITLSSGGVALLGAAALLHADPSLAEGWVDVLPGQPLALALAPLRDQMFRTAAIAIVLAGLLILHRSGRRLPYAPLTALCLVGDLFAFHIGLNDTAPGGVLSFRPPIVDAVRSVERSRVYVFDYSLPSRIPEVVAAAPQLLAAHDVAEAPGWLTAIAHRTQLYPTMLGIWGLEGSYDRDLQSFYPPHLAIMARAIRAAEGLPAQVRLLQVGAVGRVVALHSSGFPGLAPLARVNGLFRRPILVFAVPDPLPRTYLADVARVAEDREAIATLVTDEFDPRREVILAPTAIPPRLALPLPGPPGRSRLALWRPDRVRIDAETDRPAYLVLVDTYDPGWRATVDGRPAPILRANVAFRAVAIDPGRHVVEFVYRPRPALFGLALSAITAAAVVLAASRRRERRG